MIEPISLIQKVTVWVMPVLLAITLHEAAHGVVAYYFGDTTAKMMGRLTLNPFKHIDPFGTILVPIMIGFLSHFNFIFGWAKPMPVNPGQLKNPRRDMALVALAGPLTNFLMALMWAAILKTILIFNLKATTLAYFLFLTAQAGILINLILCVLNLLPIPPLDGSKVFMSFLKPKAALIFRKMEPYGFIVLLLLLVTGILGFILSPALSFLLQLIKQLFSL